jgi:NhaP-type Na+/H+ or K+/H+ antiporter
VLDALAFVLAAVAVIVALQYLADRTGLPAAALLTVAGLVYGVLPGPNLTLDPHLILTFVIPPLIYSAALNSSLLAIRENLRAVISLSIGLVLATAVLVGIGHAVLEFLLAAAGGLLCGVAVAVVVRLLRSAVRDPLLVNGISLATPFAAYLLGEELHVSGVLAVAVAGLIIGHDTPRFTSGASRLQATAVWHLADFLLQGFVFLLIGQQIAAVIRGLKAYPAATILAAVAISLGVALLLRPLWLALTELLPRVVRRRLGRPVRDDQYLSGREVAVLSWAGTRGVITLAAIFTLPLMVVGGRPFSAVTWSCSAHSWSWWSPWSGRGSRSG